MTDLPNPTPPVNPGDPGMFDLPEPQGWPKPVGITSLVLGVFNLTCAGCYGAWMVTLPMFLVDGMKQQYPDGVPPMFEVIHIPLMFSLGISACLQVLLITAGAMLMMRRGIARPLHLAYVVAGLLSFVFSTIVGVQFQVELTEWIKQNPDAKFAQEQQASGWIGQTIGWTWGILFGLAWPVFCGVWFGLVKKKASDITEGVQTVI